jgi:hypothetical protein
MISRKKCYCHLATCWIFVLVGVRTYIGKKGKRKWTCLFSMNSKQIYILPLKNICKFIVIILVVKDKILIINDTCVLQTPIVALDKWQKTSNKKRHHLASMWHLVVIVIAYFLWLKLDFSFITLDDHHSNVTFVNCRPMKLRWFAIACATTICQTKGCHLFLHIRC